MTRELWQLDPGRAPYFGLGRRHLQSDYGTFWCCQGTGLESDTKLMDSIYFHDGTSLTVNLFVPSVLNWAQRGITVTQTTSVASGRVLGVQDMSTADGGPAIQWDDNGTADHLWTAVVRWRLRHGVGDTFRIQ